MNLAVSSPWVLSGLLLVLLPLLNNGVRATPYPWLDILPADGLSRTISALIRLLGMAAIAVLLLGIAGLHRTGQSVERIGRGAHIVLLLDRSNSMDNSFAGRAPNGSEESKAAAARRLLGQFVAGRRHDRIGVVEYSTSALLAMPPTENRQAVHAAIAATATPALAYTHIAKGLAMALSLFDQDTPNAARLVVLVSDGAAVIDPHTEQKLREWFTRQQIRLYWIFLRTANSPGLDAQPADRRDDSAEAMPERYLHRFFTGLGVPYQAYKADSPGALQRAMADIDRIENQPLHYFERLQRRDLSGACYWSAALCIVLLLGLKLCEVRRMSGSGF